MWKQLMIIGLSITLTSSCISKKEYAKLAQVSEQDKNKIEEQRNALAMCKEEKATALEKVSSLSETNSDLRRQIGTLSNSNSALINNIGDLATLSQKGAENLNTSLKSLQEKDLQINSLRDAVNKRDSVTLALVTSLKGALGNINDEDIEVSVDKGVVFISISDKLLFTSGSYKISAAAKVVLGKIAKVVNNKPNLEFMVEGHTDDVPISSTAIKDNWDLSVLRATSVVRILQEEFKVAPARMTAAGRSYYVPVAENDTPQNKSLNRRTRIVVLPQLDQFYQMIEEGMEEAAKMDAKGK